MLHEDRTAMEGKHNAIGREFRFVELFVLYKIRWNIMDGLLKNTMIT